jgi:hypothetical protein
MIARIVKDTATPLVRRLVQEFSQRRGAINKVIGSACRDLTKGHFYKLNQQRHRSPNKVIGFYALAAQATHFDTDERGATITTSQVGIGQRFRGGPIDPVNVAHLAIPARDEVLDKSPRSFTDLVVLFGRSGPYALGRVPPENWTPRSVEKFRQSVYNRDEGEDRPVKPAITRLKHPRQDSAEVMYWLRKHVDQAPDDSVLPTEKDLGDAAVDALRSFVDALEARA